MAHRFTHRFREPEFVGWSDVPGLAMAFGIALLLGLVSGVIWIAWKLFEIHVLHIIPLVIQYNKRDLDGTDSEILPLETLEKDLNSMLKVPSFSASALKGSGVFETLRMISKLVVKDVSRKVMLMDKQQSR